MPRLTIGLPVYNGERHVARALDSLLGQTFGDFVLVVGDNASTDGTPDILAGYARMDRRVVVRRERENIGLIRNHNRLARLAETELFKWAAADDELEPTCVERCVAELDAHPEAVLAYARTGFIDEEGRPLDRNDPGWDLREPDPARRVRRIILGGHWLNALLGVTRTDALLRCALFPPYPDGDYVLLAELALQGTVHEVPEVLYHRRLHPHAPNQKSDLLLQRLRYLAGEGTPLSPPTLARYRAHAASIITAHLPWWRQLGLLGDVLHVLWWRRDRIALERRLVREARDGTADA